MDSYDDYDVMKKGRAWRVENAGSGILRFTLLFGTAALAFAMLVIPMLASRTSDKFAGGYDRISTGGIRSTASYTIRRSVLQPTRESVCIIRPNGTQSGDC